jgi:antitoxin component YwqK of YwqJK toxin-antitoxin module
VTHSPYVSDIPPSAEERVIERYESGEIREAHYFAGDEQVGARLFFEDGSIELESPRRRSLRNGTEYQWDDTGQLRSALPYVDGLEHGLARQWGPRGDELGSYEMRHGTGWDLWRGQRADGSVYLAEARALVGGKRHGPEWLIDEDQRSLHRETRFAAGMEHGILREWNTESELRTGYPRFLLLDREVDREEYEYGRTVDLELPAYDPRDDSPLRRLPPAVARHLCPV